MVGICSQVDSQRSYLMHPLCLVIIPLDAASGLDDVLGSTVDMYHPIFFPMSFQLKSSLSTFLT